MPKFWGSGIVGEYQDTEGHIVDNPEDPNGGDETGESNSDFWRQAIQFGIQIVKLANTPRSVEIQIQNFSGENLTLGSTKHAHGRFIDNMEPIPNLPSKEICVVGSTSRDWSIATGTEGTIVYRGKDFQFIIKWDNPFAGKNSCKADITGLNASNYKVQCSIGAGNDHAKSIFHITKIK